MSVLYITSSEEDYLQDSYLIGLRNTLGDRLIDFPKKDLVYKSSEKNNSEIYGLGFTIYKKLEDIQIDRKDCLSKIRDYELIIFSSIWRQKSIFFRMLPSIVFGRKKVVFFDGEDFNKIFYWALPFGRYYKRERRRKLISWLTCPISFTIPQSQIRHNPLLKKKSFAIHNQCEISYDIEEVRTNCRSSYAFDEEVAYYEDLASSKYGFTKKKGGWDCLRHYEIAANGSVPLFYDFESKPLTCAPHGLIDTRNM